MLETSNGSSIGRLVIAPTFDLKMAMAFTAVERAGLSSLNEGQAIDFELVSARRTRARVTPRVLYAAAAILNWSSLHEQRRLCRHLGAG